MDNGFGRTASGLIVPERLSRKREVWTNDEYKPLRRFAKVAEERQLNVVLVCKECEKPVEWRESEEGVEMVCACRRRVLL